MFKKTIANIEQIHQKKFNDQKKWPFFWQGFYIEVLNPMAFIFFLTLFTAFIKQRTSLSIILLYWMEIVIIGLIWFLSLGLIITSKTAYVYYKKYSLLIEKVFGILLIGLGVKLALSDLSIY